MEKAIQIAYDDLFSKKCRFASEAGFRHIAVNFTKVLDKTEQEWDKVIDDIGEILSANNLKCIQSHPYYYDLLLSSEITEERFEFAIKKAIEASGKLGASWCAMHPRSSISTGFSVRKSLSDNKKYFSEYVECATKWGTGIAVENLPIFPGLSPAHPFYSSNFYDLCELADALGDKNVGICWDTGHANLMKFDQAEAIKFLGKRIKCTHIHNNHNREDEHYPPDNGNINWKKIMAAFKEAGFSGPLTLETHCAYQVDDLLSNFAKHNYGCLLYLEKLFNEV